MSKSKRRHTRKFRRQWKQATKHGMGAKPKHKSLGGRTGSVRAKQRAGSAHEKRRKDGES